MKKNYLRIIAYVIFIWLTPQLLSAQNNKIELTLHGKGTDNVFMYIKATKGKLFSVDWGNGTIETYLGDGNETDDNATALFLKYGDEAAYKVIISGLSSDCVLSYFTCSGIKITELDVSTCLDMNILMCYENQITNLNLAGLNKLEHLNCSRNQLTGLDLTDCTALKELNCSENQLTELHIENCKALKKLECYNNNLTSLNLSGFSQLEIFETSINQLETIHVDGCVSLTRFGCTNNKLTSLDVSSCVSLYELSCQTNQLATLKLGTHLDLVFLWCFGNQLETLNISNHPALGYLVCDKNRLTSLDVSGCPNLEYFTCNSNQLETLLLGEHPKLETIFCQGNKLTSIDVRYCSALSTLTCQTNQLNALDVSANPLLEILGCGANQLKSLDISNNPLLTLLACERNKMPLSDLYKFSQQISNVDNKYLGTQTWDTVQVVAKQPIDLSTEYKLGNTLTVLTVTKEDVSVEENSYTFSEGTLTFLTEGIYTVTMTNEAIESNSAIPAMVIATYNISPTASVSRSAVSSDISLYPNPVSNLLYLQSEEAIHSVVIYTTNGNTVLQTTDTGKGIDVSALANGNYLIKIITASGTNTQQFVKK